MFAGDVMTWGTRRAGRAIRVVSLLVVPGVSTPAFAQNLIPTGPDFHVTGEIGFDQSDPFVLTTPDDGFVILWRSGAIAEGLRGRFYDHLARPTGVELSNGEFYGPQAVAGDSEVGFIVVGTGDPAAGQTLSAQRYSWAAQPLWAAPIPVSDVAPAYAYCPALATGAGGRFLVAWLTATSPGDPISSANAVLARAFSRDGVPLGPGVRLEGARQDRVGWLSMAAGADGNYLAAWTALPRDAERSVLVARVVGADGQLLGSAIELATESRLYSEPHVVRVGAGYILAWTGAPERNGVFGRLLTAAGTPVGSEFRIDGGLPGYASTGLGGFASLGDGFLALWNVTESAPRNTIYGQRFDADGRRIGIGVAVSSTELSSAVKLAAAADSTGGFAAAWQDYDNDLPDPIIARRFVICGDGVLRGEQCDDGDLIDGDGCDSNCTQTVCGNGVQTAGEDCDDGNRAEGDGCSSGCRIQATFTPTLTPTPTITPTPRSVFNIEGCVPHATGGCGFEFGSVHLDPGDRAADVYGGSFHFENVAPGRYVVAYSPPCNPFGCRPPEEVTVVDDDVFVQFRLVAAGVYCPGDCGTDGTVSVEEIVRCVTMALGGPFRCVACDTNGDDRVSIADLIQAVGSALTGCPRGNRDVRGEHPE